MRITAKGHAHFQTLTRHLQFQNDPAKTVGVAYTRFGTGRQMHGENNMSPDPVCVWGGGGEGGRGIVTK